ncbi:MAG: peptidase, partial [Chloroflexi bacterium]|nr:peptidase [Chloroflexota bacterium]
MPETELVVGLGDQLYAVHRPWGEFPYGMEVDGATGVATDSQDRVYLFRSDNPPVVVFERTGAYARSWGSEVVLDPHHATIDRDDRIFIADRDAHQIVVYDTEGRQLWALGTRHRPRLQAPFNHPTDATGAFNGDIYVADGYGNSAVHWFSPEGELKRTWGRSGRGRGELTCPHAVRVHPDGRVLVADRENDRVQVFTAEGEFLAEWGPFYRPTDLAVDAQGRVYVTDHT